MSDLLLPKSPSHDLLDALTEFARRLSSVTGERVALKLRLDGGAPWRVLLAESQRAYKAKPTNEYTLYGPYGSIEVSREPTEAAAPTPPAEPDAMGVEVGEDIIGWKNMVGRIRSGEER